MQMICKFCACQWLKKLALWTYNFNYAEQSLSTVFQMLNRSNKDTQKSYYVCKIVVYYTEQKREWNNYLIDK